MQFPPFVSRSQPDLDGSADSASGSPADPASPAKEGPFQAASGLAMFVLVVLLAAAGTAPAQAQSIIYVDKDANGADSGNSWTDAYTDLQTALSDASTGDSLWVAEGTYTPSSSDNTVSFTVSGTKDGVAIYGGFDGTETQRSARDPSTHTTILSGDIDGDDDPIAPNTDSDNDFNTPSETDHINGTNSEHVVTLINGVTRATILDGFTIQGGQAGDGSGTLLPDETGGGLFCDARSGSCSPTLRNLTFKGNVAVGGGGGALSTYADGGTANPLIVNSTFYANASSAANSSGGALFIEGRSTESSPVIVSSVFDNNSAGSEGGAIYNYNLAATVDPLIANSVFVNNEAGDGGAIYNRAANPTLTNVTFSKNDASSFTDGGGAIYNVSGSSPQIQNSILWGNTTSGSGAQMYNDGSGVTPTVAHSILEGGLSAISENNSSSTTDNGGNRDANPLFVDAASGDLHLNWASPAIEAGDPTLLPPDDGDVDGDGNTSEALPLDIAGNTRARGPTVDMGAHEGGDEPSGISELKVDASKTTGGTSGGSWGDAYGTLQAALAAARNEAAASGTLSFSEIWATGETYYPDRGPGIPANTQDTSFVITGNEDGLQLYGGFSGGEATRSARDPETNVTVLSGDVDADNGGADNNKTTDGITPTAADISGSNSHHVLLLQGVIADLTSSTVIDGVTITAGQADGSSVTTKSGGGLVCLANDPNSFNDTCSPELRNVAFKGNLAARVGGAIYNVATAGTVSPNIQNAVFSGNRAVAGNADDGGGAIYNLGFGGTASPTITNTVFVDNEAGGSQTSNGGGAIYNYAENEFTSGNDGTASPTLTNVTFAGNDASGSNGGAMFNKSTGSAQVVAPTIENTVLWGNTAATFGNQIYNTGAGAAQTITHTLLEGGIGGIVESNSASTTNDGGNIDANPLFVDATSGDVRILGGSPALDAGDDGAVSLSEDIAGRPRTQNGTVDIGAYEGAESPAVQLSTPTNVPDSSVDLSGTIVPYAPSADATVEVEPTGGGTVTSTTQNFSGLSFPDSASAQAVTPTITGLEPASEYEARLVGTDGTRTTGDTLTFRTDDATPPETLTIDSPSAATYKQSTATVDLTYSYVDATPDTVTITLDDGANTASFGVNDSGYASDNTQKTETLDLTSPKTTTNSGIVPGNTYDVTVTATDDSTNTQSVTKTGLVSIDDSSPSIADITRFSPTTDSTNNTSVTFKVAFSEIVTNVSTGDFSANTTISGAQVSSVNTSGSDTTVTVSSINGDGTLQLDFGGSLDIEDRAGNSLNTSEPPLETYDIDQTPPSVQAVSLDANASDELVLTVETSETLDSDNSDLQVSVDGPSSGADVYTFNRSDFSGSGSGPYTYTLDTAQPYDDGDGEYVATIDAAVDPAGNDGASGTSSSYTFDGTPPRVTAITRTSASPTNAETVTFQVSFSETVVNLGTDDFVRNTGDGVNAALSSVNTSGDTTVTVGSISGNGSLGINVVTGSATDDAGNALQSSEPDPDETYTIDNIAPTIDKLTLSTRPSPSADTVRSDTDDALALHFTANNEPLALGNDAVQVSVDGPNAGPDWKTFSDPAFTETENEDGTFTYTLQAEEPLSDGPGEYKAVVDIAEDRAGNNGGNDGDGTGLSDKVLGVAITLQAGEATRGESVNLTASVTDGGAGVFEVDQAALQARKGGAGTYEQQGAKSGTFTAFTGTVESGLVTTRGVDYYVRLTSTGATSDTTFTVPAGGPSVAEDRPAHIPISFEELSPPEDTKEALFQAEIYRMVSVPAVPDEGIKEALRDDYGPYNTSVWRLERWNAGSENTSGGYDGFPDLEGLQAGEAFWLTTKQGQGFTLAQGRTVEADTIQEIPLKAGWNQVGNPFGFPVPWQAVVDSTGFSDTDYDGPVGYRDGDFTPAQDSLAPWKGYFVYNATGSPDTLKVPPVGNTGSSGSQALTAKARTGLRPEAQLAAVGGGSSNKSASDRYTLNVRALSKSGTAKATLGLWPEAKAGRGPYDHAQPPSVTGGLRLSALEDVNGSAVPHSHSIKPRKGGSEDGSGGGQSWTLHLWAPEGGGTQNAKLRLTGSGTLPDGYSRYVLDLKRERRITPGATFKVEDGQTRRLKVIVGTEAYAKDNSEGISLKSLKTTLRANYPNPFDEETTVEYVVAGEEAGQTVTITIYNVLGQRVETLVDGRKRAGLHTARWDGTNRYGNRVGSGVFFLRLRAGDVTETQKAVLVR